MEMGILLCYGKYAATSRRVVKLTQFFDRKIYNVYDFMPNIHSKTLSQVIGAMRSSTALKNFDFVYISKTMIRTALASPIIKYKNKTTILDVDDYDIEYARYLQSRGWRGKILSKVICKLYYSTPELVDKVIVASHKILEDYIAHGVLKEKLFYIPNGVNYSFFQKYNNSFVERLRKQFSLKDLVVGYLGTLKPSIDLDLFLRMLPSILKKLTFTTLIIGGGPSLQNYKNLVHQLKLDKDVVFTGMISSRQVPDYLRLIDIAIYPLRNTPYNHGRCSLKIPEYMASELPIIASNIGENKYFLADSGTLVENTIEKWTDALRMLIEDPNLRKETSQKNSKNAKHYDWKILAEKVKSIVEL